jgi:hypothetical protein
MIERARQPKNKPKLASERITMLDDRLLHMTREEAKAYLDTYLQERGLPSDVPMQSEPHGQRKHREHSSSDRRQQA